MFFSSRCATCRAFQPASGRWAGEGEVTFLLLPLSQMPRGRAGGHQGSGSEAPDHSSGSISMRRGPPVSGTPYPLLAPETASIPLPRCHVRSRKKQIPTLHLLEGPSPTPSTQLNSGSCAALCWCNGVSVKAVAPTATYPLPLPTPAGPWKAPGDIRETRCGEPHVFITG